MQSKPPKIVPVRVLNRGDVMIATSSASSSAQGPAAAAETKARMTLFFMFYVGPFGVSDLLLFFQIADFNQSATSPNLTGALPSAEIVNTLPQLETTHDQRARDEVSECSSSSPMLSHGHGVVFFSCVCYSPP